MSSQSRAIRPQTAGSAVVMALMVFALAACAGSAPLPDEHYYRLSATAPASPYKQTPITGIVVVEGFRAAGVYSERAIVYSDDPGHLSLEHYHYQFWVDTPPRLLQEELIHYLRAANVAGTVTAETGRAVPDYRVRGAVKRFERLKVDKGWQVAVTLELRVDTSAIAPPLLVRDYEQTVPANGNGMEASIEAFSTATGTVFERFSKDFTALAKSGTAAPETAKPEAAEMPPSPPKP